MESHPPPPHPTPKSSLFPLLLVCFYPAGQSNPGAGRLNQGPVRLMDELNGLAFWPGFRVVKGPLMESTSVTTLMSVSSVDLFIYLLHPCCSLGTCWETDMGSVLRVWCLVGTQAAAGL